MSYLSPEQVAQLLKGIHPRRVSKDAKRFSHIQGYDARAHMTRIFGPARWDEQVLTQELVFEEQGEKNGKTIWSVCYRSVVRVDVCAPDGTHLATYTEGSCGDAQNQPSRADAHDNALKTSQTQAFKRAVANLGDQFGLSLYNAGALAPLVGSTLLTLPTGDVEENVPTLVAEDTLPPELVREVSGQVPMPSTEAPPAPPTDDTEGTEQAESAVRAVFEDAPAAEQPAAPPEPVDEVAAMIATATELPPDDALQVLNKALEFAVRKQLRGKRLPGTPETVGAAITRLLAHASRHVDQSKTA